EEEKKKEKKKKRKGKEKDFVVVVAVARRGSAWCDATRRIGPGGHAGAASRSILRLRHEARRTRPSAAEWGRAPARGEPSSPPRAALPAQSLCGSGRRGMCGIVTASVIEE
ncbi:hypothetical protein ALC62_15411, partial [Cyphomyrmex costatus]